MVGAISPASPATTATTAATRSSWLLVVLTVFGCATLVLGAGCANIYSLDEYTTASNKAAPATIDGGSGSELSTKDTGKPDAGPACTRNADCSSDGQSVCVQATSTCAVLRTADCPRVLGDASSDDAVILGTILRAAGDATSMALEQAAWLAAEEINAPASGGGLAPRTPGGPTRPLVIVSCDEAADVMPASRHLVEDLHVAAIVGPTSGEHVVDATQQVTVKGDTLLMTPTSEVSSIAQLDDKGLTFRNVPSQGQRAKLIIQQISDLEVVLHATRTLTTVKLGVVHSTDDLGVSARDSIAGKLIINGHFIGDPDNSANVSIDAYGPADDDASLAAIAARYAQTFVPDIVFITGAEQVNGVIVPLEQALTAARAAFHPYYVCTDDAKTQSLLDAIASTKLPPDLRRRVRGVGTRPDTTSVPVLAAYRAAFTQRYGSDTGALSASAYDAMYAVASAIDAVPGVAPSGATVARGLRALGVGNAYNVGPTYASLVEQALSAGKSVSLRGTASLMQWDANGDISGGTVEVWCVGGTTPAFGSSGLTMDVETQVVGGAFVQCQ